MPAIRRARATLSRRASRRTSHIDQYRHQARWKVCSPLNPAALGQFNADRHGLLPELVAADREARHVNALPRLGVHAVARGQHKPPVVVTDQAARADGFALVHQAPHIRARQVRKLKCGVCNIGGRGAGDRDSFHVATYGAARHPDSEARHTHGAASGAWPARRPQIPQMRLDGMGRATLSEDRPERAQVPLLARL